MLLEGFFAIISNILLFSSRVENNNSFPHPLSSEKEAEYIKKFKGGDMEARDILIKHNLRLVVYIAKKYTNYPDQDELISVGTLGLIKAINSYESGKGTQLATYASRCIENEILMTMRSFKKLAGTVSIYENVGRDKDGNETQLIDMLSVDEETVYNQLENEMVRNGLLKIIDKHLLAREKKIILLRFGLSGGYPQTQQEVSDKLGISRSYVSRIEKATLAKLKTAIEEENFYT
ncbi:MAG: RNA polymerase sporulation sigma factor SigK [Firmicutes bacterium]|nr:RNA polymerase sporulation sigma factor SigK [Bacillota bacterium]